MTTQPEALRLADALDNGYTFESQPMVVYGWADDCPAWDAAAELRRLHAECEALRATQSDTLLRLLCDLRFALGDDGTRMQPELVEYARGMLAYAERWREARSMDRFSLDRMWDAAETEADIDAAMDKRIDAARAAKEQSNG